MQLIKTRLALATLCLLCIELGQARVQTSSMLSSIFDTLSSSDLSPDCPGRCFNALAALACQEVLDEPGLCKSGFRCCKNVAERDTSDKLQREKETSNPTTQISKKQNEEIEGENENDMTSLEKGETTQNAQERIDSPQLYSSPLTVKVCPGVCVAERISNFCEAVLDVQGFCKPQLRCCVPANLFVGVENPPAEFVILNPSGEDETEESRSETTRSPPKLTTSTTGVEISTTRRSDEVKSSGKDEKSSSDDDSGIPPENRCKGTCVAGFFAFLCDSIDRTGECPRGGRCCVTQRKTRPKPVIKDDDQTSIASVSPPTVTVRRTTTTARPTTTTTRPTTTTTIYYTTKRSTTSTSQPILAPPCIGTCLPVSVASRCQTPSRLVVASGCLEDEICCDDFGKETFAAPRPTQRPPQMPGALDTLLSFFGAGNDNNRQPPPPRRRTTIPPLRVTTTPTTTTTTTVPTTIVTERPECPGTCIAPLLSFTCFGNAEMTHLFKCNNGKQSCCSPKSAITEFTRQHEIDNIIARNDSVFPGFNPYVDGGYGPPGFYPYEHLLPNHFSHNQYEQQNFAPRPYGQYNEEGYQQQYYQQNQEQSPIYNQRPNHFEQPQYHERPAENYNHYSPQPPQEHMTPPKHPIYNEVPEESASFYQNTPPAPVHHQQPNYIRDSNARQPYEPQTAHVDSVQAASIDPFHSAKPTVDNNFICGVKGVNRAARVVGGEDAIPGEWCWQVALINSLNQYLCGGALIGTQWVITAAHCVTNIVRSGDAIYVRVGDHDLTTRFGSPGAQTLPVATTYIHHNHNSQTLDNDIALLKLSSHAELGNGVCLSCLPARGVSQVAGKRCTVTGYGYMGETGPIPLRVREAEIPVVSDNECVRKINAVTEKIFILPASSFCAGGESGHDACQGDGGGPLVCNVDGYYELSGLVSWGFGCGRQDVPGVYVKVASFIGWINQIISVNNL